MSSSLLGVSLYSLQMRMHRLLMNFIKNAIVFSPAPKIRSNATCIYDRKIRACIGFITPQCAISITTATTATTITTLLRRLNLPTHFLLTPNRRMLQTLLDTDARCMTCAYRPVLSTRCNTYRPRYQLPSRRRPPVNSAYLRDGHTRRHCTINSLI